MKHAIAAPRERTAGDEAGAHARLRIPRHVGLIPDGNRRWAEARGLARHDGYAAGVRPGLMLVAQCRALGITELSIYGFTKENTHRPSKQVEAFRSACIDFAERTLAEGVALLVIGDQSSKLFPDELRPFATKRSAGDVRVNLLVNYGWQWDLGGAGEGQPSRSGPRGDPLAGLASRAASRIDLVVRWGGRRRLSGFLPIQCAHADLYVVDTPWPEMRPEEFEDALAWYGKQDVTRGG